MNFIEALNTGKIAIHPKMIGGWKMIDGNVYHRDNYDDFNYHDWVKENCQPYRIVMSGDEWYNMCENTWETL